MQSIALPSDSSTLNTRPCASLYEVLGGTSSSCCKFLFRFPHGIQTPTSSLCVYTSNVHQMRLEGGTAILVLVFVFVVGDTLEGSDSIVFRRRCFFFTSSFHLHLEIGLTHGLSGTISSAPRETVQGLFGVAFKIRTSEAAYFVGKHKSTGDT